jgi:hypothetical protein
VLASRRGRLRRAVKILNRTQARLQLDPAKTFIGKIDKGFDFLGYHFARSRLTIARTTMQKIHQHLTPLGFPDRRKL